MFVFFYFGGGSLGHCFKGDVWFNEKVAARTRQALARLNDEYEASLCDETDESILEYVRECAEKLKCTPHKEEVIGGEYIAQRFGGWGRVIVAAKLPPTCTSTPPAPEKCAIYKEEFRRQARLFKRERIYGRQKSEEEKRENAALAEEAFKIRELRDMTWGLEHQDYTDEELLEYVCSIAKEIGRSPRAKDVCGGLYIVKRFGNWGVVLTMAGLKLPRDVKKPQERMINAYLRSRETQVK